MQNTLLIFISVSSVAFLETSASSRTDDKGRLVDSYCQDAFDCYISGENGLALSCSYSVNKCSCYNTFQSIYNLESVDYQCLMSKYGPCGTGNDGKIEVGCVDGFDCIDGFCRDPQDPARTVKGVFEFETGNCQSCRFADDLDLECEGWRHSDKIRCLCREVEIADARGALFTLRNYDGNKNCSMSLFGPCGEKNGVKIDCHGEGIECVNGTCINPHNPKSDLGEPCEYTVNCEQGLLCNRNTYTCIRPKSTSAGSTCFDDEECVEGLRCLYNPRYGPWSSPECQDPKSEFPIHSKKGDYY